MALSIIARAGRTPYADLDDFASSKLGRVITMANLRIDFLDENKMKCRPARKVHYSTLLLLFLGIYVALNRSRVIP